jgi:hypothetical protein
MGMPSAVKFPAAKHPLNPNQTATTEMITSTQAAEAK